MRKNFGVQTWLYPMPVLIIGTWNEDDTPNAMNAAWGGIHDTNQIGVCIDPGHKTAKNLLQRQAFTVSIADAAHVTACDYVGIVSGNKEKDKFSKAGFTAEKSDCLCNRIFSSRRCICQENICPCVENIFLKTY